ncbi:Catalase (fragment) [Bradyrhizobium sp. STM 3843]|uniref:manganese catalase family protein n=1 Tax=Bradyrhizobium sp. STM 3843 TaxID=551947 RepID=UPI00024037E3
MQDMLSNLIARDTMHQQQWLAIVEDLGGASQRPIPNGFDRSKQAAEFAYMLMGTARNGAPPEAGRYCEGPSLDGNGQFTMRAVFEPLGEVPNRFRILGTHVSAAQREQMNQEPRRNALT